MMLGIVIKGFNAVYFENMPEFYHEFIPQLLMLGALFGYMDALIIVKWLTDYSADTSRAPSIVTVMIEMFLNFGTPQNPDAEDQLITH